MSTIQTERWDAAMVIASHLDEVGAIVDRIITNARRYKAVDEKTGVPWYVIAGLHNMESSGCFSCHLHEGSPLTGRTRYVPKGRPIKGDPPFTWEESAMDAIAFDGLSSIDWKSLDAMLYACERYNGTGYLRYHLDTPTPYLWAKTSIERPGKYTSDGKWDGAATSKQVGIAAIFKVMETRGILDFSHLTR